MTRKIKAWDGMFFADGSEANHFVWFEKDENDMGALLDFNEMVKMKSSELRKLLEDERMNALKTANGSKET